MTTFFTADLHFYHKNIIKYINRPFDNVINMNNHYIKKWNAVVDKKDNIYVIGDFAFTGRNNIEKLLRKLNGIKHLIIGNHDDKRSINANGWKSINNLKQIKIEGQTIILCHYGLRFWNKSHYGSWCLYGHSHGKSEAINNSFDVGIDVWDKPLSFEEVKYLINIQ